MSTEQNVLEIIGESIANWDWDFAPIWSAIRDSAYYFIDAFGWWGWAAVILIGLYALLHNDLTHYLTSQLLAHLIRGVFTLILGVAGLLVLLSGRTLGGTAIARIRDIQRFLTRRLSPEADP